MMLMRILICFFLIPFVLGAPELSPKQGEEFLNWSLKALELDKKYLVMGVPVFLEDFIPVGKERLNKFWNLIGLQMTGDWVKTTFKTRLVSADPAMTDFEINYPSALPAYPKMYPISPNVHCILNALDQETGGQVSCLMSVFYKGRYVANEFGTYYLYKCGEELRKWYLNPFLFFAKVFQADSVPKPDTTTLAGRRIYYSHVDGDGWNNETELKGYLPWTVPEDGDYEVTTDRGSSLLVPSRDRQIQFALDVSAMDPIQVNIRKAEVQVL